jgi:hypothetical protein
MVRLLTLICSKVKIVKKVNVMVNPQNVNYFNHHPIGVVKWLI